MPMLACERMKMRRIGFSFCALTLAAALPLAATGDVGRTRLPDGRTIAPTGFTVPVEGFASNEALSPDGAYLAVLSQDGNAIDVIDTRVSMLADRISVPGANNLAWTSDGLYVTRGYSGILARFSYERGNGSGDAPSTPTFTKRTDLDAGGPGVLGSIAEDPATHRIAVTRSADRTVMVIDDTTGALLATMHASGQPFDVVFSGNAIVASDYNSDRIEIWPGAADPAATVVTGPHPTRMLADGARVYIGNADGATVSVVDVPSHAVVQTYDLSAVPNQPPGQTPSGMALAANGRTLFVCESGFNDVAVVDVRSGKVRGRIPTAWYPMAAAYVERATVGKKDPRKKPQLWIVSARGIGQQPDPAGEWNGHMTGLVQHVLVDPTQFAPWSAQVASDNRWHAPAAAHALPPIKHVVFIVIENKHFDEQFGDEPRANADPTLLVYGRKFTPNMHALAERYALFDEFMGNGDASIYGHSWTTQGYVNDYQERNARLADNGSTDVEHRVAWSIWPYAEHGEDTVSVSTMNFDWYKNIADLPEGPRLNPSAVFGPRGELIDALAKRGVSFRVYGEQMTVTPEGRIATGLGAHAARDYPGAHIDFGVLDTQRAKLFIGDLRAHGLASYTYMTLPTDHTAGTKPGFYTPQSYIANNDLALGQIVSAISARPEWKSTVIFVAPDDAQGTGDHVDAKRMPVFAVGPYVRHGAVIDTLYSFPSILRTVGVLFGAGPLNIEDAASAPILDVFASKADARTFSPLPETIGMEKNPGEAASLFIDVDGPDSLAIPDQEWVAVHGTASLRAHHEYLARLGTDVRRYARADP
ncbi:MAG: bifunctional YncE family protein/alkaline phosphatase family protein [Candidatus Eremiobacteraeota bacterium]|nr:bifunctional YncE family protein/alkaline phosphatase family protein [Candidatus Eremiobacteraeota bacterium]